jgi:histidinol-phosphate aminotransferase
MTLKHIRPSILAMPDPVVTLPTLEDVAARHGLTTDAIIKLDANENLYGPSPKAVAAVAAAPAWNAYPDVAQQTLTRALADYAGVRPEQIVVASGCDELIAWLPQLLVSPGDEVINIPPSFYVYEWATAMQGGKVVSVPRLAERGYAVDMPAVLNAITERTRLVFLCNPNNPTGDLTVQEDIEALLRSGVTVAVDETYHEFCGVTMLPLLERYENLIVMRSMSKWAGLAGLRVGYGIMQPQVARQMQKLRMPFNVNRAGYIAAIASIEDRAYLLANAGRVASERERLFARLQQVPFLRPYPSCGNFILCAVSGAAAGTLRDEMEHEGVLVRVYTNSYLPNAIRISVGKPEHSEAAVTALHVAGRRLKLL